MRYLIDHLREMKTDDRVRSMAANAVVVDIQNVVDYFALSPQGDWEMNKDLPSCMPPFDCFDFEYRIPDRVFEDGVWRECNEIERGKRMCHLISTISETETSKEVAVITYSDAMDAIRPAPFTLVYEVDKKTGQMIPQSNRETGETNWYRLYMGDDFAMYYSNMPNKQKGDLLNFTKPMFLAMSFMNCNNVRTVVHRESIYTKSRNRAGRPPLVKVYTLQIDAIKKMIGAHSGNDDVLTRNAFHICRGHFKDFSHGQGLFGKYKGRYWWPMTTRGSKEAGEVIKDYAVKV